MSLKNLLVLVDDHPTSKARLDAAIALAQAHDAHLTALGLGIEFVMPAPVLASLPVSILDEHRADRQNFVENMMEKARNQADKAGIPMELRSEVVINELAADMLARHSRHADLTIVGQAHPDRDDYSLQSQLVEAAFLESGRPALVIPYAGQAKMPSEMAIVAWDGTKEAARALNDSLPILAMAKDVRLITVDAEKLGDQLGELPGADATLHLARHGIKAELRKLSSGGMTVSDTILAEIGDTGADLLVMGGYGHSRMREMILGGTTARLLETMTASTFLAH